MKHLLGYAASLLLIFVPAEHAAADLTDDLVVYFTFNHVKGKRILDESGNGLDAKVMKNTKFVEGKYGAAVHISHETEDCINIPASEALEISGEITMMAWVYQESWIGSSSQWFDKGCYSKQLGSYGMAVVDKKDMPALAVLENGSAISMILSGEGQQVHKVIEQKMKDRTWHHVVGTCSDKSQKIYLDGAVISESVSWFAFAGTNDEDLRIGCAKGKPEYAFEDGYIDEVAIWRRVLSEDEIKTAMRGPLFSVSPKNKTTTTWADMKSQR